MSGMKGKCLSILHIYQDHLWALGEQSIQVPFIPSSALTPKPVEEKNEEKQEKIEEETNSALVQENLDERMEMVKIDEQDKEEQQEKEENIEKKSDDEPEVNHEKILEEAFLCAIKFKSKEFKLPVLVSTFMKTLQSCW
jgi:translation initiation factor 2D